MLYPTLNLFPAYIHLVSFISHVEPIPAYLHLVSFVSHVEPISRLFTFGTFYIPR